MRLPRDIEPCLLRSARTRPVVLTGARQTGKTCIFRQLFPNHEFASLDLPAEAQPSTLAKLAPPHTAAHKLGHQLLNFRTGTSLGR
jgi:hypothetical protein